MISSWPIDREKVTTTFSIHDWSPDVNLYYYMSNSKAFKLGRDARTGEFVPVEKARRDPDRYVVEHVPKKGYGDVGKDK